jgi:hypothetical protein
MPGMKSSYRTALLLSLVTVLGLAGCRRDSVGSRATPIYQQSLGEIDQTIRNARHQHPELNERMVALARQNLGQPYEMYLLGEAPFETIDAQPVFTFSKSDCVVFVEHTLAMALSDDLPSTLRMLQRIRYRKGEIGVLTRNHYTEADWNVNNRWLLRDITAEVGGSATQTYSQRVNWSAFFRDRYKLNVGIPSRTIEQAFIPSEQVMSVAHNLRPGDVVQFVRGNDSGKWVGHLGLVSGVQGDQVKVIHSAEPAVKEQSLEELATGKNRGFAFLRVVDDPIGSLRAVDGTDAPRVVVPLSSPTTWDAFVASVLDSK